MLRKHKLQALAIRKRTPQVLESRGLDAPISRWELTDTGDLVLLFGTLSLSGLDKLERYCTDRVLHHLSTVCDGLRCLAVNTNGLRYAFVLHHEPQRLPERIPLTGERLAPDPYTVTLGVDRRGPVILDVAGDHRAILMGGATGSGKTNAMQTILAQLALQHKPAQVRLAIVDTKEVDFTAWRGLPHLFAPIAGSLDDASELIEAVEAERLRRKALMVKAGVKDWRRLPDPLPLLVLAVDEAADFQGTEAMDTLTQVARKGRAMGVSVLVGTQYPTSKVIDPQVKANLPTAIALRCRTRTESRVILDKNGAEKLDRPGLAMSYLDGAWRRVQVLEFDQALIDGLSDPGASGPVLKDVEAALVRYAIEELDGAFTINKLYDAHAHAISKHALSKLGRQWERRGWLTEPEHATAPRKVTPELTAMLPDPPPREGADVTRDRDDTASQGASERDKGRDRDVIGENPTEAAQERVTGPVTAPVTETDSKSARFCPVTACQWNSDGRGACDYAHRGLRCGDPQWREEWKEAMSDGGDE